MYLDPKKIHNFNKEMFIFGMSNINIYNGSSNLCEYVEEYYHNPTTYDSIEKFLQIYNPIETIYVHNLEGHIIKDIFQYINNSSQKVYEIDLNNKEHSMSKQACNCESQVYQDEIIQRFFPNINLEIFKYNIADKPICIQSYCFLLNFVQQHNVCLIEKIEEPQIENMQKSLVCANHSFQQLNYISQGSNCDSKIDMLQQDEPERINSVMCILNQCKTKMGKNDF